MKYVEVDELETVVGMKDIEGNDVAYLMGETGVAEKAKVLTAREKPNFISLKWGAATLGAVSHQSHADQSLLLGSVLLFLRQNCAHGGECCW